jgi:hypothetical protein
MKCTQCSNDNNLKDRTANQGRCKSCNHPFAFEPTAMTGVKITDPFFMKAIADISGNGTLFFTAKQFLYFLDKRSKRKSFNWFTAGFIYIFFSVWMPGFVGGFLSIVIGSISFPLVLVVFNLICIYLLFEGSKSPKSNYQTRKSNATALQFLGIIILVTVGLLSLTTKLGVGYVFVPIIGGLTIALGTIQKRRAVQIPDSFAISATQLIDWLNTWARSNGAVAKLLPKPASALPATGEISVHNTDVSDYSFDRLVVCNSPEIAQVLIANNFHFENNCAILSIGGYPANIFDTVLQMLRRNPDLMVYAFHDASPDGVKLVHELRTSPGWFQEYPATIIDLGLLPRQVIANPRHLFIHRSTNSATAATRLAPEIRQNLTPAELEWLDAGNYVELESFTPQKLIQILNRGIAGSRELDTTDAGGMIWIDNSGSSVYAVESFG